MTTHYPCRTSRNQGALSPRRPFRLLDGPTDRGKGVRTAAIGIRAPPASSDTALRTHSGVVNVGDIDEGVLIERPGGDPRRLERVVRHASTVSPRPTNSGVFRDRIPQPSHMGPACQCRRL
jgi:hypothetical protein